MSSKRNNRKDNRPHKWINKNKYVYDARNNVIYHAKGGNDLSPRDCGKLMFWAEGHNVASYQHKRYKFSLHEYCYGYRADQLVA